MLYHDASERERLLDLTMRLQGPFAVAVVIMCVPVLFGGSLFGWHSVVPLLAAIAVYIGLTMRMASAKRPELLLLASSGAGIAGTLGCIWLAEGPKEYLFAIPVFPALGMAPIFARRVSVSAAILTSLGLIGVALGSYGDQVRAMPPILILPVMMILVAVLGAMASRDAEHVNRSTAVVDPLTGLLNRVALQSYAAELALQARASGASVGLLIADLDHFKQVNDVHGHATGDEVLVEAAARLRAALGSEVPLFRFGGEEFVVLLPNVPFADVTALAERLRGTVAATQMAGIEVRASFGVGFCADGTDFDYEQLFQQADAALYEAKATGRDRVCASVQVDEAPLASKPVDGAVERRAAALAAARSLAAVDGRAAREAVPDGAYSVRLQGGDGNWLVADATERGHVVDLLQRCAKDSDFNSMISFVALMVCGLWLDWWGMIPIVIAGAFWKVCTSVLPTSKRPEYAALCGLMAIILASAVSMPLANQTILFALPMGALITVGASATFRWRGAAVIAATAVIGTTGAALVMDAAAVAATPFILAFPIALILATSYLGHAMGRSAREHRVASITDGLTGTLNRAALDARIPLLVQQSLSASAGLAIFVVDIDHFKRVNDEHGHDIGDEVLSEVSYRLRRSLRAFDSVYRVGGEEFVIVLTNITGPDARMVAERTRRVIEVNPISAIPATVSIGVAWVPGGRSLDYDATFQLADDRLYRAKQTGRNRVVDAGDFTELELLAA